ncbi:MAG: hypothetical protein IT329_14080 [Caldilineaceae bacterium]|nr:hypothetical protein [Caldilineaceae bacterium]
MTSTQPALYPDALSDFEAELRAVQEMLTAAIEELGMPLGELIRAQSKQTTPTLRAALILAAGYDPRGDAQSRRRRLHLAAALEMLYLALHVHRLLVNAAVLEAHREDLDRSFIGSTILAGDYCFSRAAGMAAQTDSPAIVTRFAQALQTVSEGHLRALFASEATGFDENRALLEAGAEAAPDLAGLPLHLLPGYRAAAADLAATLADPSPSARRLADLLPALPADYRPRWQALARWLMGERTNGQGGRRSTAPRG